MEQVQPLFPTLRAVHSQHPARKERVQALRNGEIQGLLTTTILERGVTIERLEVAVIGAEHEVFYRKCPCSNCRPSGTQFFTSYGQCYFFSLRKKQCDGRSDSAYQHDESRSKEARFAR